MGALATPPKWIPEDDLLLKNAVEAGASLESLAKGAVCFSRRFTHRELLERWHSLLYDPVVSAEASAQMIEFEIELSSSNPPKSTRACLKGKDSPSEKRKVDSIKSHYHAWRKRICNRPYTSVHPDLPEALCSEIIANCGYDCGGDLNHGFQQHRGHNIPLQEQKINYFGHPQTGCGNSQNVFPGVLRFSSNSSSGNIVENDFHNERIGSIIDRCEDGIGDQNPIRVYTRNLRCKQGDKTEFNNASQSLENDYIQKNPSHEENIVTFDASSEVREIMRLDKLPSSNHCVSEDAKAKPLAITDSVDDNGIAENNNIEKQVSYHQLECSSNSAELPLWGTIPDISGETMTLDMHLNSKEDSRFDDNNKLNAPGFDNAGSEANKDEGTSHDGINNLSMVSESVLMEMDYIAFEDDFLLFNEVDKEIGSILLNSPSDTHQEDIPNSSEPKEMKTLPAMLEIPAVACFGETNRGEHVDTGPRDDDSQSTVAKGSTSTCSKASHTVEPLERLPPCLLNIEDLEIPSNDHVSASAKLLPNCLAPINISSADERLRIGDLTAIKEELLPATQTSVASSKSNSAASLNVELVHSDENCLMEAETFGKGLAPEASRDVHITSNSSCMLQDTCPAPDGILVEDQANCVLNKQDKFNTPIVSPFEKPAPGLDHCNMYSENIANGFKNELNMQAQQNCAPLADLTLPQPAAVLSTSDLDERLLDSEDDVPNFSDIEAMILDMDLGPYDQESCLFNTEVSQYQPIHSKKTIIRLEQGAQACMNRKISSNGAFAVFYGRHLKYFIRTPQISLGRATEDVKVDVDLSREGRANKISRRQAIIKMDDDGSFFLKNVGKYSIFLNGREIVSQKCVNLTSGSLIEIRNLRFVFEVNQSAVRSYLAMARKRN